MGESRWDPDPSRFGMQMARPRAARVASGHPNVGRWVRLERPVPRGEAELPVGEDAGDQLLCRYVIRPRLRS